jgi:hypothetical protein
MKNLGIQRTWLERHLLNFIKENNPDYKIINISYSSDEQIKKAYELKPELTKIIDNIQHDENIKKLLNAGFNVLDYIHGAVFEDKLGYNEDNTRDEIQTKLDPGRLIKTRKNVSKRKIDKFAKLYNYYSNSQLGRNKVYSIYGFGLVLKAYIPDFVFSPKVSELYASLEKDFVRVERMVKQLDGVGPRGGKKWKFEKIQVVRYDFSPNRKKKVIVEKARNLGLLLIEELVNYYKNK